MSATPCGRTSVEVVDNAGVLEPPARPVIRDVETSRPCALIGSSRFPEARGKSRPARGTSATSPLSSNRLSHRRARSGLFTLLTPCGMLMTPPL